MGLGNIQYVIVAQTGITFLTNVMVKTDGFRSCKIRGAREQPSCGSNQDNSIIRLVQATYFLTYMNRVVIENISGVNETQTGTFR